MNAVELGHEALKMTYKMYGLQKTLDEAVEWGNEALKMTNKMYGLQKTLNRCSVVGPWSTKNSKYSV